MGGVVQVVLVLFGIQCVSLFPDAVRASRVLLHIFQCFSVLHSGMEPGWSELHCGAVCC